MLISVFALGTYTFQVQIHLKAFLYKKSPDLLVSSMGCWYVAVYIWLSNITQVAVQYGSCWYRAISHGYEYDIALQQFECKKIKKQQNVFKNSLLCGTTSCYRFKSKVDSLTVEPEPLLLILCGL